ncbi:MAG TPA: putative LPS assembly protein LptD [Bacteroidota bacterium]|nr:putative LPS assembly protein LptD [Bacteroidota bacterium]
MNRVRSALFVSSALALLVAPRSAVPQAKAPLDSAAHAVPALFRGSQRDSLARRDSSAARDTSRLHADTAKTSSGIDSVVSYTAADTVVYNLGARTMTLFGKGDIKYRELALKAERVDINWVTSLLHAEGIADTADTTGKKMKGLPEMVDGSEVYHGRTVDYDFRTKKGRIDLGKTEEDKSYYYGDEIKKVEPDVMYVEDGKFTSCDLEHPHYYFGSPEMKIMLKDKIVARPVFFYIDDVPVFALPFGIFPSERGRRSGLIGPAFGESTRGRYLTHLGYYWAMTDYTDVAFKADGYSKGSYTLYGNFNYKLRYDFQGDIEASFGKVVSGEPADPGYGVTKEFNVHIGHSEDFDPTAHLAVDFTFTSGSYYQNTSFNLNQLLEQNAVSNATFTKSWEGTPNSMTVNIHRDQYLQTGQTSTILPDISFNHSQSFPFRSEKHDVGSAMKWYELISYTYAGQFEDVQTNTPIITGADSGKLAFDERRGIMHQFTLNMAPKAGYVTLTPFFNYTEKWYDEHTAITADPLTDNADYHNIHSISAVRYYNMGLSASTKFFGIFQPDVFGIKGIRHQVTPSLSYTYAPDFSTDRYGYYGQYRDTLGAYHRYGLYDREVFGGAPAGTQQAISLSVGNVFEMKTASHDTSGQDNKFQLLNLNAGISYNFAADSLRLSELALDYRTSIGNYLSIGGSTSYNFYKFVRDTGSVPIGQRVNRFLINTDHRLADLTAFTVSIGTHLSGEKHSTTAGPILTPADSLARAQKRGYVGLYDQEAPDFSIPWNLDLNWNYTMQKEDPLFPSKSSGISASLGFNLTEFWKITATTSYDLINRVFTAPQITVYRDLHCWELNFNWVPTGPYRNFHVEIRLKAPQLQDVKITKQGGLRGIE